MELQRFGVTLTVEDIEGLDFVDRWFSYLARLGNVVDSRPDLRWAAGWMARHITGYMGQDDQTDEFYELINWYFPENSEDIREVYRLLGGRLHVKTPYSSWEERDDYEESVKFLEKCEYPENVQNSLTDSPRNLKLDCPFYFDENYEYAPRLCRTDDPESIAKVFPAAPLGIMNGLVEWSVNFEIFNGPGAESKNLEKILRYHEASFQEDGCFRMILPTMEGDLDNVVFSTPELISVVDQMTEGLMQLHNRGFLHNDLKPANFLYSRVNGVVNVKLTDFELSSCSEERTERKAHPTTFTVSKDHRIQTFSIEHQVLKLVIVWMMCKNVGDTSSSMPKVPSGISKYLKKHFSIDSSDDFNQTLYFCFRARTAVICKWLRSLLKDTVFATRSEVQSLS